MTAPLDLLVLGSGVAGLTAAVAAADRGLSVGLVTKGRIDEATTRWAQGGVAAVLGGEPSDSPELHAADTLAAGAGLCDTDAVNILVGEGPQRVEELMALGAQFDRERDGRLALAREGGHAVARVVHAGGSATGLEVERALVDAVRQRSTAVHEGRFALDLVVDEQRCVGISTLDGSGRRGELRARHVLVATGGAGQLYAVTTNPPTSTGDGIAVALRAGVAVADIEIVQFHPTALHVDRSPRPLLSEALRGHGAVLRNHRGDRFVDELEPRDVVARAIMAELFTSGHDHVFLDARDLDGFTERFPNIAASLSAAGLDPAADLLPVAPAAHYLCGGVVTDLDGATSMPGLWAAGEVACVGVHGANRLASNSLLDGMVFGHRVVEAIVAGRSGPAPTGLMRPLLDEGSTVDGIGVARVERHRPPTPARLDGSPLAALQRCLARDVGVVRDEASLRRAEATVAAAAASVPVPGTIDEHELANLALVAAAVVRGALARTESRGAHTRSDHPETAPALHLVQ